MAKRKGGRPPALEFDDRLLIIIKNLAKQGKTDEQIAEILGVAYSTLRRHEKLSAEFSAALKEGKSPADDLVEQSLFSRAVGYRVRYKKAFIIDKTVKAVEIEEVYPPDTTACIYWLKNRKPDQWRDRKEVDLATSDLSNVKIEVTLPSNGREVR